MTQQFVSFSTPYSILPTQELVEKARDQWLHVRDLIPDANIDEAIEMDTVFTALNSRLTGYAEVMANQNQRVA